jgi:hypothetical protein
VSDNTFSVDEEQNVVDATSVGEFEFTRGAVRVYVTQPMGDWVAKR